MKKILTLIVIFVVVGFSFKAAAQCTLDLGPDTVYCGYPFDLDLGSGYQTVMWNNGSTANSITVDNVGIYAVTVTQIGQNAVLNGDFSMGNTGFICAYTYNPASVWNNATYTVDNNAHDVHSNFSGLDHTNPPTGLFLICNGSAVPGTVAWQQTVNVTPNTDYIFSAWVLSCVTQSPAQLQFNINGGLIGPIFPAPSVQNQWIQFYTIWNSGTNTTAIISIVDQVNVMSGNDFGLDDIYFAPVIPCVDSIVVMPSDLDVDFVADDVNCFGESTGSVDVNVTGGYPNYGYTWNNGAATQDLNNIPAGSYSLTVTDAAHCTDTISMQITQPNLPISTVYDIVDVDCFGNSNGSIDVTVGGGVAPYTYDWGFSNQQDVNNLEGGVYTLTLTDAAGCEPTFSYFIDEPDEILISLSAQSLSCAGDTNGFVSATVTGGVTDYNYQWSNGGGSYAITNLSAGTYILTILDHNGCVANDTAILTEPMPINLYTTPDQTICFSESTEIVANAIGGTTPYQYFWTPGGLANNTLTVTPEASTEYCVYIRDANNCFSNLRCVSVYVNPPLEIELELSEDTICQGESVELFTSVSGGNGGPYVIEQAGAGTILAEQIYSPERSVNLIIYAYDGCGTPAVTGETHIEVIDLPPVGFTVDQLNGCQPLTVAFDNLYPNDSVLYEWTFDDASFFDQMVGESPTYTFLNSGVYTTTLFATDKNNCKNSYEFPLLIEVYPKPVSIFESSTISTETVDPVIEFYNHSIDGVNYYWAFGDGDSSFVYNPMPHSYDYPGEYLVSLVTESMYGCRDTSYIKVEVVKFPTFYVPNAINPFSYLQQNRIFKPLGVLIDIEDYLMLVYNRWGEVIFSSNDPEIGWDGRLDGGELAPQGSYTWLIQYNILDGKPITKSGTCNLIY